MSEDEEIRQIPERVLAAYPIYDTGDIVGNTIKLYFRDVHMLIEDRVPECRERSIALTNLEQACMWAVKATFRK